jgi:hypothetical protein
MLLQNLNEANWLQIYMQLFGFASYFTTIFLIFICQASGVGGDQPTGRQAHNGGVCVLCFMRFKE